MDLSKRRRKCGARYCMQKIASLFRSSSKIAISDVEENPDNSYHLNSHSQQRESKFRFLKMSSKSEPNLLTLKYHDEQPKDFSRNNKRNNYYKSDSVNESFQRNYKRELDFSEACDFYGNLIDIKNKSPHSFKTRKISACDTEYEDERNDILNPLPQKQLNTGVNNPDIIEQNNFEKFSITSSFISAKQKHDIRYSASEPLFKSAFVEDSFVGIQKKSRLSLYERRRPTGERLRLLIGKKELSVITKLVEKPLMDLKYPTVLPPNPQLKALLIFHKSDNISENFNNACLRQQLDVTVVKTKAAAIECLNDSAAENYHLIIIDARFPKLFDAEYLVRSIRHTSGCHFTTIIAITKKSFFDKDESSLIALLDAGVNRCIVESPSLAICSTEIRQVLHSLVRPYNVMSTQQALYTALHRLKEVLIITDDLLRIQYANKAAERLLNMRLDEIISRPLAEIFLSDVSSINSQGKNIREFDGILTVKRKGHDGIPMHVRVVPVVCIGRSPTHFVFNFDVPGGQGDFIASLPQPKEAPRGSLHSIRRGSFDVRSVASDGLRRTSLAKLTSLPLEAPITKVVNLLSQVQDNCSQDEARLIDKVLEFLKREGLYSPQMKEIKTEDPIATDLIGALLTGPTNLYSSRRSSNDSIIRTSTSRTSGILPAKMKANAQVMELLEESLAWDFDIFKLEEITEKRPLLYLGMEIFRRFDVFATFNTDENTFKGWLAVMEAHYHSQNSYHNSTHAADVMQATGVFLTQLQTKDLTMDRMDEATALIAAATHDIDHPGRSSAFLCNSDNPLAVLYNDLCVLESHHAAITFRLTTGDDKINIFKNLDRESYKNVRSVVIDMILATEMTRHFEHLAKFVGVFGADVEPREMAQSEDDNQILIRRMMIKCADVSNPARAFPFCVEWARRIAEEYFTQTDEEKKRNLPIVMPMFDRATCSIPKSQIGFIEYIIQDMMHAWDSFIDMPELIHCMQYNYAQWKKFEEQGIHTLENIKSKQITLNVKKSIAK